MAKKSKLGPRDPSVMQKAWATRRKNAKKARRMLDQPNPMTPKYDPKKPLVPDMEAIRKMQAEDRATGSTARRPKKARAGKGRATRRSKPVVVEYAFGSTNHRLIDGPLGTALHATLPSTATAAAPDSIEQRIHTARHEGYREAQRQGDAMATEAVMVEVAVSNDRMPMWSIANITMKSIVRHIGNLMEEIRTLKSK